MKNLLIVGLLFLSFATQAQATKVDSILSNFYANKDVLVASHRGAHQNYAENSISAINECIRLGVDIVELDVRETKDGELIIMHDRLIDRTTNGTGKIIDLTWSELQKFNLVVNGKASSEKIPTLEEVLKITKGKIIIDIDFKADSEEAIKNTLALIKKYGMHEQILFFLYDYKQIPLVRSINSRVKIMPRAYSKKDVKNIFRYESIYITHIDKSFYKSKFMKKMIDKGSRVWINALGKYDDMERQEKNSGFDKLLKMKYVNVIQTDLPEQLLKYLREKNLHK
ncbi:glycerophosphodiester phosphodiesterase family protein [Algibacter pacificus]|uniref:glycerophosphodiester phosphodiesterase family protein n=1 Tax=Algibacter pacificus TaxID=2599389 RepID=UPI0011C98726|nr:glycerophosphodiester phosphodiesterase family protein [Algibacter pacificus]